MNVARFFVLYCNVHVWDQWKFLCTTRALAEVCSNDVADELPRKIDDLAMPGILEEVTDQNPRFSTAEDRCCVSRSLHAMQREVRTRWELGLISGRREGIMTDRRTIGFWCVAKTLRKGWEGRASGRLSSRESLRDSTVGDSAGKYPAPSQFPSFANHNSNWETWKVTKMIMMSDCSEGCESTWTVPQTP